MKKKIIILIISIAVLSLGYLIYYNFFDTFGLVCLQDNENIVYVSKEWRTVAGVSDTGNCYIGGHISEDENYGVDDIRKFKNYPYNKYVSIYDKGDAKSVKLEHNGGTIITENNEVYIFLNNNETYRTPKYFCKGYTSAVVGYNSKVYMLSENGDLVRADINAPENVEFIGNNVKEFNVTYKDDVESIFALTNDNKLYIINTDEQIENSKKYFENIYDFDVLVPHGNLCVLSLLDNNNNAYVLMDDYNITYEDIINTSSDFKKAGENVSSVTSYEKGIAIIDDKSNVSLYGSDLDDVFDKLEFQGEVVFDDVKSVFGGAELLIIIKNNGDYYHYGMQLDGSYSKGITL